RRASDLGPLAAAEPLRPPALRDARRARAGARPAGRVRGGRAMGTQGSRPPERTCHHPGDCRALPGAGRPHGGSASIRCRYPYHAAALFGGGVPRLVQVRPRGRGAIPKERLQHRPRRSEFREPAAIILKKLSACRPATTVPSEAQPAPSAALAAFACGVVGVMAVALAATA